MSMSSASTAAELADTLALRQARRETLLEQLATAQQVLAALQEAYARALADGTPPAKATQLQAAALEVDGLQRAVALLDGDIAALDATRAAAELTEAEQREADALQAVQAAATTLADAFHEAITTHVLSPMDALHAARQTAHRATQTRDRLAKALGQPVPPVQDRVELALRGQGSLLQLLGLIRTHMERRPVFEGDVSPPVAPLESDVPPHDAAFACS